MASRTVLGTQRTFSRKKAARPGVASNLASSPARRCSLIPAAMRGMEPSPFGKEQNRFSRFVPLVGRRQVGGRLARLPSQQSTPQSKSELRQGCVVCRKESTRW